MTEAPKTYSYEQVEAALCIWEWIMEPDISGNDAEDIWYILRTSIGTAEMRGQCLEVAEWLLKVYHRCIEHDELIFDAHPFDWEVVPMIMRHCVTDNGDAMVYGPFPDIDDTARKTLLFFGIDIPPHLAKSFRVVWEIDIEAGSPVAAAAEAIGMLRDLDSTATIFKVDGKDLDMADYMSANPAEYRAWPLSDWRREVANGDTTLGYREWVDQQKESGVN